MEFFNKKEEVLDVQLTEYGKQLLGRGMLKPVYYAFFDDDVLYNIGACADTETTQLTENQNETGPRIQYDTPRLKIQNQTTSAERRVTQFLVTEGTSLATISVNSQPTAEEHARRNQQQYAEQQYLTTHIVGSSALNSPYNPAWQLSILSEPIITSAATYLEEELPGRSADNDRTIIRNIPQIDITIDYETYFSDSPLLESAITDRLDNTGVFLALRDNYLMLELIENNTDFEKENFDIEVFQQNNGPSAGTWTQISFASPGSEFSSPTTENVEYYMNILVDEEIADEVVESRNIAPAALRTSASRLRFNRNLYTTINEEPCE
jgi:hypothetical protein